MTSAPLTPPTLPPRQARHSRPQAADEGSSNTAGLRTRNAIARPEIVTKILFYYFHERFWAWVQWGASAEGGRRQESLRRTTTKTFTFRTIATLDTIMLAWFFTGSIETALSIGGLEVFTKLTLYFFHERLWARLPFGIVH